MRQPIGTRKSPSEKLIKDIKRATRKQQQRKPKLWLENVLTAITRSVIGTQYY